MNLRLIAAIATAVALLPGAAPAAEPNSRSAAERTTDIVLAELPEGEPLTTLYARDNVIHDGALVLPVDLARPLRLLGRLSGGDYAVQTIGSSGYYGKLFRVDGETGDVVRIGRSYDLYREPRIIRGGRYMAMNNGGPAPARYGVLDTETGEFVATRRFPNHGEILDADDFRILIGTQARVTFYWFPFADRVRFVRKVFADPRAADAKHGLAVLHPHEVGSDCPAMVRTKRPGKRLWEACKQAPLAFSPNGERVAMVPYRGYEAVKGISEVRVRSVADGTLLRRFRGVEIESLHWDGDDHLAMVVHDERRVAAVRCDLAGACERVSDLVPEGRLDSYQLDWTFPVDREAWASYEEDFYYDEY